MSRREKVIQMSDASLGSQWQESGRKTTPCPSCSSLWDSAPASCSPWEGKGAVVGDEGQSVLSYTHSPITELEEGEG